MGYRDAFWCSSAWPLLALLSVQELLTKVKVLNWERNVTVCSTGYKLMGNLCRVEVGTAVWPWEVSHQDMFLSGAWKGACAAGQGAMWAVEKLLWLAGDGWHSFMQSLLREIELKSHVKLTKLLIPFLGVNIAWRGEKVHPPLLHSFVFPFCAHSLQSSHSEPFSHLVGTILFVFSVLAHVAGSKCIWLLKCSYMYGH